jgi:CO dehydrogenase maturation factor
LLGQLDRPGAVVVADLEAGLGTLTRIRSGEVDVAVVVVEPTAKSLEVAARALELAAKKAVPRRVLVANRVRSDDDLALVRAALPGADMVAVVPDDPAVRQADRAGVAPLDAAPGSPAVTALAGLATGLLSA